MRNQHETVEIIEVTPALARYWLSKITPGSQRPLSESRVARFVQDMLGGRWVYNGQSLVLDKNEVPIDGQHRLTAVALSGVTVRFNVSKNVSREIFPTIDSGQARSVSDILGIGGHNRTHLLGAIIRWLYAEERNALDWVKIPLVPHTEAIRLANTHNVTPSMFVANTVGRRLLPPSLAVYLHYRFSQIDPIATNQFFQNLDSGEGLLKTQLVFQLRERLLTNRAARSKYPHRELCALTIKGFNAERSGARVAHLRWRHDEAFPQFADE